MKTALCFLILAICVGCTGVPGGVVNAGVSGLLMGSALNPIPWPFEENPKKLQLNCDGKAMTLVASPERALLTLQDETVNLNRVFYTDQQLRYGHVFRVAENDQGMTVDEKQGDQYEFDWLLLIKQNSLELERNGVSLACQLEDR